MYESITVIFVSPKLMMSISKQTKTSRKINVFLLTSICSCQNDTNQLLQTQGQKSLNLWKGMSRFREGREGREGQGRGENQFEAGDNTSSTLIG